MNDLTRLRRAARLNQSELAREANISRSVIVMLEGNYKKARQSSLDALEDVLRKHLGDEVVPPGALAGLKDTGARERGRRGGQASAIKEHLLTALNQQEMLDGNGAAVTAPLPIS